MSDYSVTLSTTEPNNYVGLIKLRQGDVASQSIQATITANGQLFNFDRLSVFFNAVLPNGNVIRDKVTDVDYVNSKLNYIVADSFLQEVAQVTAWFSFENGEKIIDSTKNFQYSVIGGWKECIPQGNYIYELSEIQREIEQIIGNKDFTSLISKIDSATTEIVFLDSTKADKNEVAQGLASKVDKGGNEQVSWANLSQEAKKNISGDKVAVVGDNSVTTSTVADNAITRAKTNKYSQTNEKYLDSNYDLNTVFEEGRYVVTTATNKPSDVGTASGFLVVEPFGDKNNPNSWVLQTFYSFINQDISYSRILIKGSNAISWVKNASFTTINADNLNDGFMTDTTKLTSAIDLNGFRKEGHFMGAGAKNRPSSYGDSDTFFLINQQFGDTNTRNAWSLQRTILYSNPTQSFERLVYNEGSTSSWKAFGNFGAMNHAEMSETPLTAFDVLDKNYNLNNIFKEGNYVVTDAYNRPSQFPAADGAGYLVVKPFGGKYDPYRWVIQTMYSGYDAQVQYFRYMDMKSNIQSPWKTTTPREVTSICCMGDSITQNDKYQSPLSKLLGIPKIKVTGFGGTTVCDRDEADYKPFSFINLVHEIVKVSDDATKWAAQDAVAANTQGYDTALTNLKAVDFKNLEYLTLFYGTNDYGLGYTLENYQDTYKKALSILQYNFPRLKIIVLSPMWRQRNSLGDNKDADYNTNGLGKYLKEYIDATIEVSKTQKVPFKDMYHESGVGINNYSTMMIDGLHPSDEGGKRIAECIAGKIKNSY
ncbi:BppU family phage baseplate upper protein [Lactococcus sp. EKM203L]|uniref:SGNH/GDSL hydrolase family protein n=10 Tax=Lactococcus TaxID=1357 RepID=UPI0014316CF6|nr:MULTISPECIES: SGNH/GDSL hydrolase family protein [unclassified Lactococcus]KAF6613699.1 BppU family phage baseplate upper protein [Lactococcus sp. EKM203L]KAF6645938.1 BppU family phage baseplate upper protein [Lactococcus sp. EKM502L]KAF6670439.1 BppU family phage baseplate upper protein [Lactococcus sp. EKM102L]